MWPMAASAGRTARRPTTLDVLPPRPYMAMRIRARPHAPSGLPRAHDTRGALSRRRPGVGPVDGIPVPISQPARTYLVRGQSANGGASSASSASPSYLLLAVPTPRRSTSHGGARCRLPTLLPRPPRSRPNRTPLPPTRASRLDGPRARQACKAASRAGPALLEGGAASVARHVAARRGAVWSKTASVASGGVGRHDVRARGRSIGGAALSAQLEVRFPQALEKLF